MQYCWAWVMTSLTFWAVLSRYGTEPWCQASTNLFSDSVTPIWTGLRQTSRRDARGTISEMRYRLQGKKNILDKAIRYSVQLNIVKFYVNSLTWADVKTQVLQRLPLEPAAHLATFEEQIHLCSSVMVKNKL